MNENKSDEQTSQKVYFSLGRFFLCNHTYSLVITIVGVMQVVGMIDSADIYMINTITTNCGGRSDNLRETPFFQHDSQAIIWILVIVKIEIPTYDSWLSVGGIEEGLNHFHKVEITIGVILVGRSVHCNHL